jgi:hypothetical protein
LERRKPLRTKGKRSPKLSQGNLASAVVERRKASAPL